MGSAAKDLFTEQFQSTGQIAIEPGKFAAALQLQIQELAQLAGVHRATVREAPSNLRLQSFLRESVRVLAAATEVSGDQGKAMFWFRNEPIRDFGYQTAEKLVSAGKADAVIDYLQSIESGSTG
jgi:uncharacterized protein (DUF2384 family)